MPSAQALDAQALYDSRGSQYDDTWHPRFARHMVELAGIKAGEHVLDLACGTGLVTFPASQAVGASGSVVGVDISAGMLLQAHKKLANHDIVNIEFHHHSITELDSLTALKFKERTFDVITCASALVLLPDPVAALKHWTAYLKPFSGRMIVDVTHIQNQVSGITFERVGRALDIPIPYYRLNFPTPRHLEHALSVAGLGNIQIMALAQTNIPGSEELGDYITDAKNPRVEKIYDVEDSDEVFEAGMRKAALEGLSDIEARKKAKQVFREEWTKLADQNGQVLDLDFVHVAVGFMTF